MTIKCANCGGTGECETELYEGLVTCYVCNSKDVHTEHCCILHGCKYGDDDCSVEFGDKKQSHVCEHCYEFDEFRTLAQLYRYVELKDKYNHLNEGLASLVIKFNALSEIEKKVFLKEIVYTRD